MTDNYNKNDTAPILTSFISNKKEEEYKITKEEEKQIKDEERFIEVIKHAISIEINDDHKEEMKNSQCFVRLWHDPSDNSYCDFIGCIIKKQCEMYWQIAKGGWEKGTPLSEIRRIKKGGHPLRKNRITKVGKQKTTKKFKRYEYMTQCRPVDKIAESLWNFLGEPPSLPINFIYPTREASAIGGQRTTKQLFIDRYGDKFLVVKKISYHNYFFNGKHLMRLWVSCGGGGWLDITKELAKTFLQNGLANIKETPASGKKNKYKFYPFRVYINSRKHISLLKKALINHEGLEYLNDNSD